MNSYKKYAFIALATGLVIAGCRKEKEVDNDTNAASDGNFVESMFNEVKNITDAAASGYLNLTGYRGAMDTTILGCATVIHDTTVSPRTLTIDYGPTNCECGDGRERRGKIIVSYTGPYRQAGTVITHSFDNFFIEDNQITGTKVVTNMGNNGAGHPYYTVDVNGSVIKAGGGGTITWSSDRIREWYAGYSTWNFADDVYYITGNGNGTRADGTTFTMNIASALEVRLNCRWIESGVLEITPSGKPTRSINFGASGSCDNDATCTINGNTYNIQLW